MPRYKLYLDTEQQGFVYRTLAGILSLVYSFFVKIRNLLYDKKILKSIKLPGICISVGNITVGGTGKSPLVMEIAQKLQQEGFSPVIVTRGYKSSLKRKEALVLLAGKILKKNFSRKLLRYPDEAMMYSHRLPNLPVLVGPNRKHAAQWLLEQKLKPSHWILDDGFQHRKIARDFDLVLLDAESPWGNSHLLPLGSLREPLSSLKRADAICFTRSSLDYPSKQTLQTLEKFTKVPTTKLSFDFKIQSLDKNISFSKEHEPMLVMCGIAQDEKFIRQIESKGIVIGEYYCVGDHEPFLKEKVLASLENCHSILTTEKDYWRNPSIFKNLKKAVFLAQLRIFPNETNTRNIFEVICQFQKKI